MASNSNGKPTPPDPHEPGHELCPVCAWRPCTKSCRFGLDQKDLDRFERMFVRPAGEGVPEGDGR